MHYYANGMLPLPILSVPFLILAGLSVVVLPPWIALTIPALICFAIVAVVSRSTTTTTNSLGARSVGVMDLVQRNQDRMLVLLLLGFCVLIGARSLTAGASVGVLPVILLLAFTRQRAKSHHRVAFDIRVVSLAVLIMLSFYSWLVGWLQTDIVGTQNFVYYCALAGVLIMFWIALSNSEDQNTSPRLMLALLDGVGIYLVANVVLYYGLGLHSPAEELRAASPGAIGLFDFRVVFPLTNALSIPALLGAGYLAAYPFLWRTESWSKANLVVKLARLLPLIAGVVILLAAGSRIAVGTAIVLLLLSELIPEKFLKLAIPLTAAALLLPFWWNHSQSITAPVIQSLGEAVPFFARGSQDESVTLNSRTVVWRDVETALSNASPDKLLTGYGANGHIPANMLEDSASLFTFLARPDDVSLHNSMLQQFVDQGLIGAAALAAVVLGALYSLIRIIRTSSSRDEKHLAFAALIFLLTLLWSSATEDSISSGSPSDPFWLLLLTAMLATKWSATRIHESLSDSSEVLASSPVLTPSRPLAAAERIPPS